MEKISKTAASLIGESMTELQCDGLSGYSYGGGGHSKSTP